MEHYNPQVDDYVVWEREVNGKIERDEGWVYFKSGPVEPKKGWTTPVEYITIEVGVKPKPFCNYAKNDPHKMIHILLLCYKPQWEELKYVKHRREEDHPDNNPIIIDIYKSQDRPLDY